MIISASRRTDIPAFYAPWMLHRLKEGFCTVPNPFNRNQVRRISLRPEDVDAIVFWTRNPRPLMPYLEELDALGYRYYFQYTILGYPREIDPKSPALAVAVATFRDLAERVGPQRVVWRYDPILFTGITSPAWHHDNYQCLAQSLKGFTKRSVISLVDMYGKIEPRMKRLEGTPAELQPCTPDDFQGVMRDMAATARANAMEIVSCAEQIDLRPFGIAAGKCIDDRLMAEALGINVLAKKDPAQREACGCVISRDIGMYESCLCGCLYCYATKSFDQAQANYDKHDPRSPSMLGWYDPPHEDMH